MVLLRWIGGGVLAAVASWLSVLNWSVVWRRYALRQRTSSWIPLLGGFSGVAALILLPTDSLRDYWWVPLIVDWGCVPGFAHALWRFLSGDSSKAH